MITKTVYICEKCEKPIESGYIFHGNLNVIESYEESGGIIGNNFPLNHEQVTNIFADSFFGRESLTRPEIISILQNLVKKSCLCERCFLNIKYSYEENEDLVKQDS